MDKNAIKRYAVWARRELISRVSQRAAQYEITADGYGDQNASNVHGRILSADEKKQRSALIVQIKEKGYEQVMEEIAYTWFNRFSALRFMEVNGYLPTRVRVFTDDENNFKPQILTEAINMELDGLDMQKVYDLKNANDDDALFKYMIIVQCNALSKILPGMFQRISDYTELLFPDNLLREGSVVEQMIAMIPQEDWTDQVQIIGWLYEGYNTERNEMVYDGNMSKSRITKDLLPAATTIFTPDWPIRYMVENSLGRLWLEGHPNDSLKAEWKYYLDEVEQEPEVQAQLAKIRKEYAALKPEDILAIDPCQGSGHILAYMFDVLVQIYEAYGYSAREAAASIVEHNIWGLDIDERAAQLAYFSVMMKARQYDRRFFSRGVQPHVYTILESNNLDPHCIEYFVDGRKELKFAMDTLVKELHDAKEYGSILNVTQVDFDILYSRFEEIQNETMPGIYSYQAIDSLLPFVQVAQAITQKYHIVITNPPYLGNGRFSPKLDAYVKDAYPNEKADLSMVMYRKALYHFSAYNGLVAFITTTSWMFLSSFEKTRQSIFKDAAITSLVDFGTELFEGKVGHNPIVAWVTINARTNYRMTAIRLVEFCYSRRDEKEPEFFNKENYYYCERNTFFTIPGNPITYWVGEKVFWAFTNSPALKEIARARSGAKTGKNELFIMNWWEVNYQDISFNTKSYKECQNSSAKWFPHNKGGVFRNWYGNRELVVRFERGGALIKEYAQKHGNAYDINATDVYFHEGLTWTALTSYKNSFRYSPVGCVFDTNKGPMLFNASHELLMYILGFMISPVAQFILKALNQSLSLQNGDVDKVPLIINEECLSEIAALAQENVEISKTDYDENELSFDFSGVFRSGKGLSDSYSNLIELKKGMFTRLKQNSERINRYFISLYGVEEEVEPDVIEKDLLSSCNIPDKRTYINKFISYAVGCMMGRYSLDSSGIIYAGGAWDNSRYSTYQPDKDAIIPICDDEYFEDDIVGRFISFIEAVYGAGTLEENLQFVADAIGGKGSPREIIRKYFINDFYDDHVRAYQKTPIYWLFDSGKKNGFKCLIYMHRYQPDTIARIRTDYVHEQQSRYRTAIADLESRIATAGTTERVKLTKQLDGISTQAEELRVYEEKIHHLADQMIRIDLDDGVKVNYAKFQDVLAKIK